LFIFQLLTACVPSRECAHQPHLLCLTLNSLCRPP
jgi:hypothetical protein